MTTKGARGEAILTVEDREIPILLTNRALGVAEAATGKSMSVLAVEIQHGTLGVADTAHLLHAGMEYGRLDAGIRGKRITLNDAYAVMDHLGWLPVAGVMALAMTECLTYDSEEPEGEGGDAEEKDEGGDRALSGDRPPE